MRKKFFDPDDAPPLTGDEVRRPDAKWRIGGKEVSAEQGKAAFRSALTRKTRVNIHLDNDVIAHYKAKAGGRGYQTLINAALRLDMEGTNLQAALLHEMDRRNDELQMRMTKLVGKVLSLVSAKVHTFAIPILRGSFVQTESASESTPVVSITAASILGTSANASASVHDWTDHIQGSA